MPKALEQARCVGPKMLFWCSSRKSAEIPSTAVIVTFFFLKRETVATTGVGDCVCSALFIALRAISGFS